MRRKKPLKSSGFKKKALGDTHSPGKEPGARKHADDTTGTSTGRTGAKNNASGKKKAPPKPKVKAWIKPDGKPKRGFNKDGSKKVSTILARVDGKARRACHARGVCETHAWKKWDPPESGLGEGGACGGGLQWSHILGRSQAKWVRHAPEGCVAQCAACHNYAERHKHEFYLMIEELFPGRFEYLQKLNTELKEKFPKPVDVYIYWEGVYDGR